MLLLNVRAGNRIPDQDLMRTIRLGPERRFENDPKYPLRLLVDTAIMALSPAINDPTTAVQALDQIGDLMHRLGSRELNGGYALEANGDLRVIFPAPTWDDYLSLAFDEIRQYGSDSLQVLRRLRSTLVDLAELRDSERVDGVLRYLRHLDETVERSELDALDRRTALREDPQGLGLTRRPL
jgi:uncharacterized membrane protein